MKMLKMSLCLLVLLFALVGFPDHVSACACCTEPGEYRLSYSKPTEYELDVLHLLRFGVTAHLFTTDADLDEDGKGLKDPSETYSISGGISDNILRLAFRDGLKTGTLNLTLPPKMVSYRADIYPTAGSIDPKLLKEWRFEGPVKGTGLFRSGIDGTTKYFLVFQGRGNNCDSETDFSHWRLEIRGKRARYAFYGELQKETVVSTHAKGTFEVKMNPQAAEDSVEDASIGRMALDKVIHGDLEATSKGQMLAAMSADVQGSGAYVALERVIGALNGRKGTFALQHTGTMTRGAPQLTIRVVPDSGTGELIGLEGTMTIDIVDGKHFYDFEYTISKSN